MNIELENFSKKTLYWRVGDGVTSLIEVGLDGDTGALTSITLTMLRPDQIVFSSNLSRLKSSPKMGSVNFNIGAWNGESNNFASNFIDEFETDFKLEIGEDVLKIIFIDLEEVFYIQNNFLILGFSKSNVLISITILDINISEFKDVVFG